MTRTTVFNWMLPALLIALAAGPLTATPIATGPAGVDILAPGSLTYEVVMREQGTSIQSQGFVPGGRTITLTSTGDMALANILEPGSTVSFAILELAIFNSLTPGEAGGFACSGAGCGSYTPSNLQVAITPGSQTTITVASTSGTTYTWTGDLALSPFQLDLATANPDFLADLADGQDLTISWTQSLQLRGTYPNPTGNNRCQNCTLTFTYEGLSQTSTVQASVRGDSYAVPEPSTALLLGVGIMGLAAVLRRKVSSR